MEYKELEFMVEVNTENMIENLKLIQEILPHSPVSSDDLRDFHTHLLIQVPVLTKRIEAIMDTSSVVLKIIKDRREKHNG